MSPAPADTVWVAAWFLLGAIARDAFGDPDAARRGLRRALDLAEPDQVRREALTPGETRVLCYLPTNLSAREIARELYLSVNTVRTHQRHLYQKLGARSRTEAVGRARALGLLAPFSLAGAASNSEVWPSPAAAKPGQVRCPLAEASATRPA
jgi:LuxR family transcriptional regulator, maltose regulon positive regulatory protein